MKKYYIVLMMVLSLGFSHADSNTPAVNMDDVRSGELLFVHDDAAFFEPATQLSTDVTMKISGMVARVTVAQRFHNTGDAFTEALYVFPLPEDAAVDTLRMRIDDRVIEGEIQTRDEARINYEAARDAGQQASLVEQERPNLFTTNLANIPPDAEITVEISYLERLDYEAAELGGSFSMRFPLAITPRYHSSTGEIQRDSGTETTEDNGKELTADDTGWATEAEGTHSQQLPPINLPPASPRTVPFQTEPHTVSIAIELDAGFPLAELESLYHPITQEKTGNRYHIHLAQEDVPAGRDFALRWSPDVGSEPAAAIFHEEWRAEPYALVMLMPPSQARATRVPVQAREVIFILDTSGSMDGISIEQAKEAMSIALGRLNSYDKFNIIEFNSTATQLYRNSQLAHRDNIRQARGWVRELYANGGTEMLNALNIAFADEPTPHYLRQIIFITDGAVDNETQLFQSIDTRLGDNRLFTVGIGAAPNSYFMRKAAEFGRGSYTFIADIAEVQEKMDGLFTKLESPVLTGVEVYLPEGSDAFPSTVPDLYAGEPVIMQVKLPDTNGVIRLSGEDFGQPWTRSLTIQGGGQQDGISQLWARAKIEELSNERDRGGNVAKLKDIAELKEEITHLALHHHLVSDYTSLVAIDPTVTREATEALQGEIIPLTIPHGQLPTAANMVSRSAPAILAGAPAPVGRGAIMQSAPMLAPSAQVATTGAGVATYADTTNEPLEPANTTTLTCWDSNGNGQQDTAEDRNSDGVWDIQDCVGDTVTQDNATTSLSCDAALVDIIAPLVDVLGLELVESRANEARYTFISQESNTSIHDSISKALEQNWQLRNKAPQSTRGTNQRSHFYECTNALGTLDTLHITFEPIGRSLRYTLTVTR